LTERQICDLELLANGAFSPLAGFMNSADYQSVIDDWQLADGRVFPIPITLPVENPPITENREIVLRDTRNNILALLEIEEIYEWNKRELAERIFETRDSRHPLVAEINRWGKFNVSGILRVLQLPKYYDFQKLRLTPKQTREKLSLLQNPDVVAFQTRNPLHRAHEAMIKKALAKTGGAPFAASGRRNDESGRC
jgi:sulfate adenylyltransferase